MPVGNYPRFIDTDLRIFPKIGSGGRHNNEVHPKEESRTWGPDGAAFDQILVKAAPDSPYVHDNTSALSSPCMSASFRNDVRDSQDPTDSVEFEDVSTIVKKWLCDTGSGHDLIQHSDAILLGNWFLPQALCFTAIGLSEQSQNLT